MTKELRKQFVEKLCNSGATKIPFGDVIRIFDEVFFVDGIYEPLKSEFVMTLDEEGNGMPKQGVNPFKEAELAVAALAEGRGKRGQAAPATGMNLDTSEPQPNAAVIARLEAHTKETHET
jgi:hypothetical protein